MTDNLETKMNRTLNNGSAVLVSTLALMSPVVAQTPNQGECTVLWQLAVSLDSAVQFAPHIYNANSELCRCTALAARQLRLADRDQTPVTTLMDQAQFACIMLDYAD